MKEVSKSRDEKEGGGGDGQTRDREQKGRPRFAISDRAQITIYLRLLSKV